MPRIRDSRVFFTNSGSEANEAAIKFAKAYRPHATYFINFKRAFHGKTTGALSITSNEDCQAPFRPLAYETLTLPFGDLEAFEALMARKDPKHIIAVMLEPIQGEAGIIVPPQAFLSGVDRVARKHGIPVIADEIQAGLARSGYLVPSIEWGGMSPDIITFAKPLGGGLTPVGAAVARKAIYKKMLGGMNFKTHSNTFGGNSMSMAIGLKSLEIIREEGLVSRSKALGEIGLQRLEALAGRHPKLIRDCARFRHVVCNRIPSGCSRSNCFGHERPGGGIYDHTGADDASSRRRAREPGRKQSPHHPADTTPDHSRRALRGVVRSD